MGNMTTRTIASAAERIAASTYLWGHTSSGPAVDRRFAATDILMRDANGDFPSAKIANTSAGAARLGLALANKADSVGTSIELQFITHSSGTLPTGSIKTSVVGSNNYPMDFSTYGASGLINKWRIEAEGNFRPFFDNAYSVGIAAQRCSVIYAGTGSINTSDEREKADVGAIPEEWLDAWADVQWARFKFIGGNRWHVGLIAQEVHAAFAGHGLDAFEIGLCCFDKWNEEREPVYETVTKTRPITVIEQEPAGEDENGEPLFRMREVEAEEEYEEQVATGETRVTLEAGDRWGLRYDECQAIEAAWQRRELARMVARLTALESPAS